VNPIGLSPRPGVDAVYDEVVKETDRVWAERDALNSRAGYLITTGGVVVGLVTAVLAATAGAAPGQRVIIQIGMVVALLLFVAVVSLGGAAYGQDDFRSINPNALTLYASKPNEDVKWDLISVRVANHLDNRRVLAEKTRLVKAALYVLVVEVVWLAVVLGIVIGAAR